MKRDLAPWFAPFPFLEVVLEMGPDVRVCLPLWSVTRLDWLVYYGGLRYSPHFPLTWFEGLAPVDRELRRFSDLLCGLFFLVIRRRALRDSFCGVVGRP